MASYTYTLVLNDTADLFEYLKAKFAFIPQLIATTDTQVIISFSAALIAGDQTILASLITDYLNPSFPTCKTAPCTTNSTMTTLAVSGVFTGTWQELSGFTAVQMSCLADVGGTIAVQFGITKKQADFTQTIPVTAAVLCNRTFSAMSKYFRVVYTNGSVIQASFSLLTTLSYGKPSNMVALSDTLVDTQNAEIVRSVLSAHTQSSEFKVLSMNERGMLRVAPASTKFEHLLTSSIRSIFQIKFTYGLNSLLTNSAVTGSGVVAATAGLATITTGITAASSATINTNDYVFVTPGQTATVVISAVFGVGTASSTQLVGVGNATNGLFFGYLNTVFGVCVRANASDTWITQTSFNMDKVNGTGSSGINLNTQYGNSYVIIYDALGFGTVSFGILGIDGVVIVHRHSFLNTQATIGLPNPHLQGTCTITKTAGVTSIVAKVASFAAYLDGGSYYPMALRSTSLDKAVSSQTYVPIFTLRNCATFNTVTNACTMVLTQCSIAKQGAAKNYVAAIVLNATLTGGAWSFIDSATSVAEINSTATAYSAGTVVWTQATFANDTLEKFDTTPLSMSPGDTLTLIGRVTSNGTATTTQTLTWVEVQ
jgi:hypothetical protein